MIRRLLSADALGLLIVLIALQVFSYGIASSLQATDTTYLFWVCLIAAGMGYALHKRKWHGLLTALVIAVFGLVGVWILGAKVALPLVTLLNSIVGLLAQVIPAIREQIPLDTDAVWEAGSIVMQASSALALRWQSWLIGINSDVRVNDPLIRNLIWTLLMWSLAAWTGWFTAGRSALHALLPAIVVLALVLSYSEYRIEALWLLVFLMLLLMGLWNYKNNTNRWQRRKVDYSDSILYDNTQAVLALAISIGAVAFIMPSISWRDIQEFFRERNSSEAAEMLGIREQPVAASNTSVQKPSLPREHLLTEGFAQSQELVMAIRTGELPPISNPVITADAPRHYWRSTIYDEYMSAGWLTSYAAPQNYTANTPLIPGLLDGYQPLQMDVQLYQPEGKLFWSGVLYSADIPFRADWRVRPGSNLFAGQTDLLQADLFAAATGADSYHAEAYIPIVTVEELRLASMEYPEEIRGRYLQLPRDLPPRVHELAKEITGEIDNPYDKARAIESYLRTNYPYDLQVPAPPADQDVSDYFLFDLKRGYCDYYATSMVVLARASGLPARFVSGYASGSYDAPSAQYTVRKMNAHSWPEIYFPEIGWIEFEPTASQPEIERAETIEDLPAGSMSSTTAEKFLFQLTSTKLLYWISPLGILLLLVAVYFTVFERLWILRRKPVDAIGFLYRRYYRMGRSLAGNRTRAETASEFTYKLISRLDEMDKADSRGSATPRAEAQQLTNIYLRSLFSNHSVQKGDSGYAFELWKQIRRQLLGARFKSFILRWLRKIDPRIAA
jgi:transglutaminase-like putative cysteine protease